MVFQLFNLLSVPAQRRRSNTVRLPAPPARSLRSLRIVVGNVSFAFLKIISNSTLEPIRTISLITSFEPGYEPKYEPGFELKIQYSWTLFRFVLFLSVLVN